MHPNQPIITTSLSRRAAALFSGLVLLAAAAPVFAHGGFDHVMGFVTTVSQNTIIVKTAKGSVKVLLNDKTEFTKDSKKAVLADLLPGMRVVVDIPEGSKDNMAHSVKIGATAATADHEDDHDHAHK